MDGFKFTTVAFGLSLTQESAIKLSLQCAGAHVMVSLFHICTINFEDLEDFHDMSIFTKSLETNSGGPKAPKKIWIKTKSDEWLNHNTAKNEGK